MTVNVSDFNSLKEILVYASGLKGGELATVARDMDIPGRSKLNAETLREVIGQELTVVWQAEREEIIPEYEETESQSEADRLNGWVNAPESNAETLRAAALNNITAFVGERFAVVPNRADKRRAKRARNLRNDGAPKGGWVKSA